MNALSIIRTAPFAVLACLLPGPAVAQTASADIALPRAPLASEIGAREVSFLAQDLATGASCALEGSDLDSRHAPWSTFKIANLVIALETGAAQDLETARVWDQARRPPQTYWPDDWRQDQTLLSAFRRSAIWYFQDVALDVGSDTYRTLLRDWGYGNAEIADGADGFWLGDSLQISVAEQVAFLGRLVSGDFDVDAEAFAALAEASAVASADGVTLHGKSGSGTLSPGDFAGPFEGWFVGWLDRTDGTPAVFALYAAAETFAAIRHFRQDFAIDLLSRCGLLPSALRG